MENNIDKLIEDQLASLPADAREAVSRVPWEARVQNIAKREGLSSDKAASFRTETMLILYGFELADNYVSNLARELDIDEEQAQRIADIVSKEIIEDIEKQVEMIDALTPSAFPPPATATGNTEILNIPPEIMAKAVKMPSEPVDKLPEVAPVILPETVPGQTAHDVPHTETPAPAAAPVTPVPTPAPQPTVSAESIPKSIVEEKLSQVTIAEPEAPKMTSYPNGQDPYREPIE